MRGLSCTRGLPIHFFSESQPVAKLSAVMMGHGRFAVPWPKLLWYWADPVGSGLADKRVLVRIEIQMTADAVSQMTSVRETQDGCSHG